MVSAPYFFLQAAIASAVLLGLLGLPGILLVWGIRSERRKPSIGAKTAMGLGAGGYTAWAALVAQYIVWVGPGLSGIVAHGHAPDGREYCIVQTYADWAEPYQVSFYIRVDGGRWRWNYLGHEDPAWRSGEVVFTNSSVLVSRSGNRPREIDLPSATGPFRAGRPEYFDNDLPAHYSVDDVAEYHNSKYGSRWRWR